MLFIQNKYTKWYYQIIESAKSKQRIKQSCDGMQTHHIIPRSLSGNNDLDNLVVLTYREHKVCHHC